MVVLNENEFEELMDEITHRFSKANIDGTLKALLEKLLVMAQEQKETANRKLVQHVMVVVLFHVPYVLFSV